MPTVKRTSLQVIAPLFKTRLSQKTGVEEGRIFWMATDTRNPPHFMAPNDFVLRVRDHAPQQDEVTGGGKWSTRITRTIDVCIRVQLAVDPASQDDQWLFADNGYIAMEEATIDALQMWDGRDASGNLHLDQPCRLVQGITPFKSKGDEVLWGDGTLGFELVYTLDLDTTGE